MNDSAAPHRWRVPVRIDDVPEDEGLHLDLVADAEARARIAGLAGIRDLPRLEVSVDLTRRGNDLLASGRVSATVGQTCVVTLEPMESAVDEAFDVVFAPDHPEEDPADADDAPAHAADDPPEPLIDGIADMGAVAVDFLLLGIDPYPRRPDAVFETLPEERTPSPFAALAKLKPPDET